MDGRPLFNLGFGYYDVPRLFDAYGDITLMAQGSDSKQEYIDKCRASCSKKCGAGLCKNAHRRISIYRGFVDEHFQELSENYIFKGGEGVENQNFIERYQISFNKCPVYIFTSTTITRCN